MTRAKAQEAVDAAFADGVKELFGVLVQNIIRREAGAEEKFAAGIAVRDEAHAKASSAIERIFPE